MLFQYNDTDDFMDLFDGVAYFTQDSQESYCTDDDVVDFEALDDDFLQEHEGLEDNIDAHIAFELTEHDSTDILDFDDDYCTSPDDAATIDFPANEENPQASDESANVSYPSSENENDYDERNTVLQFIEDMVLDIMQQFLDVSVTSNTMGSGKVKAKKIRIPLVDRKKPLVDGEPAMKYLTFPRQGASTGLRPIAKPPAQLLRVAVIIQEGLITGVPTTKRDIFYKDKALFKTQSVVNNLVDDLAATWGLERSDLGVRAAVKGLICGSGLTIRLISGEVVHCKDTEPSNIPMGEDIEGFSLDPDVAWVLIIEKEAVFQTLCRLKVTESLPAGRGLIITGRGYPDVATRHLVATLSASLPPYIPVAALVDCDPYGLDILSVYRFGSTAMRHENEKLAAGRAKWLGVRLGEVAGADSKIDAGQLLPLTERDRRKIQTMLLKPHLPQDWKDELEYSMKLGLKAEIEILSSSPSPETDDGVEESVWGKHPLSVYLESKLRAMIAENESEDAIDDDPDEVEEEEGQYLGSGGQQLDVDSLFDF